MASALEKSSPSYLFSNHLKECVDIDSYGCSVLSQSKTKAETFGERAMCSTCLKKLAVLNKGVSGEFLGYQLQIEQWHNAIIWNPSKGNRIKEMRRLEELCEESTETLTSEVYGLEIPNAIGFNFTFPNLKFLTIGSPDKKIIDKLRTLQNLEYLTIEDSMPIFTMFKGFDSLELLTLKNIQNSYQITNLVCGSATSRYISIHVMNIQVPEFLAVLFRTNRVQCTNITVNCEKQSVDYQEWKIKDKIVVNHK